MQGILYVNTLPSLMSFSQSTPLLFCTFVRQGHCAVYMQLEDMTMTKTWAMLTSYPNINVESHSAAGRMINTRASLVLRRLHQERQQRLRLSRVGKMSTNAMAGLNQSLPPSLALSSSSTLNEGGKAQACASPKSTGSSKKL